MSFNSVYNHTRNKQIGLLLRGCPILLSIVWLHSVLNYCTFIPLSVIRNMNDLDFKIVGNSTIHQKFPFGKSNFFPSLYAFFISGHPILLSLVWLQTELDFTQPWITFIPLSFIQNMKNLDFKINNRNYSTIHQEFPSGKCNLFFIVFWVIFLWKNTFWTNFPWMDCWTGDVCISDQSDIQIETTCSMSNQSICHMQSYLLTSPKLASARWRKKQCSFALFHPGLW